MFQTSAFCDSRPVVITFFQIWVPFWTPFWTICCNYFEPDFQAQKIHEVGISCACLGGLPRTHHRRGGNWEPFGIHLETSGRMEAEEASGGQISYYVPHSRTECKSCMEISILRGGFDGTINYDCTFTVRYERRLFTAS